MSSRPTPGEPLYVVRAVEPDSVLCGEGCQLGMQVRAVVVRQL